MNQRTSEAGFYNKTVIHPMGWISSEHFDGIRSDASVTYPVTLLNEGRYVESQAEMSYVPLFHNV